MAFYKCASLKSIVIPDNVDTFGESMFRYCSNLTSVVIGKKVLALPNYTFTSCNKLESVTIPNSVASITGYTFYGCNSLNSITIPCDFDKTKFSPDSVTYITVDSNDPDKYVLKGDIDIWNFFVYSHIW